MSHDQVKARVMTPGMIVLLLIAAAGLVAAVFRWAQGLGATTNLSDQWPWGIWIGIDVMSGVALAAGGFTTAAAAHLFGGKKYHALVRPAVLTGMLGYAFVGIALLVDLALPWHIVNPIWMWPEHSVMFEVAWCVMLYLAVLILEFMPAVFERFNLATFYRLWRQISPVFSVVALAFFVYILSHSWIWAIATLVVFTILAFALPAIVRSRPGVPLLLIQTCPGQLIIT